MVENLNINLTHDNHQKNVNPQKKDKEDSQKLTLSIDIIAR